ncbi:MAG: hypothetical protein IJF71_00950 [Clostridia bacterium]|nr:hypothetical protein [Clostridia bacterium]
MTQRTRKALCALLLGVMLVFTACGVVIPTDNYTVTVSPEIVGGSITADKSQASTGDTVTLTVTPDEEYQLVEGSLMANGIAVEGNTFEMPSENVEITAEFQKITYAITATVTDSFGTAQLSKTRAAKGETVTVTLRAAEGYEVDVVKVNGEEIAPVEGTYSFVMPGAETEVEVSFTERLYAISVEECAIATVTTNANTEKVAKDTEITVSVEEIDERYEFVQIEVNGEAISGYTFRMPAADTVVKAIFRQVRGESFQNGTPGWDLSADAGENPALTVTETGSNQTIWSIQSAAEFYFETKLNVSALNPNDGNPTTGIILKRADGSSGFYFHIKVKNLAVGNEVRIMPGAVADYNYQWSGVKVANASAPYSGEGNYATLAVAKVEGVTYYYFNGTLVYKGTHPDFGTDKVIALGLQSMGVSTYTYYDYQMITDAEAVRAKLAEDLVTVAAAPSWTEGMEGVGMAGSDEYAGLGVTFYAKAVEGGVKIAAVANHNSFVTGFAGGDWWRNTNFELYSGATDDAHHFFLTANTWAADNTQGNAFYRIGNTTVAEGFIDGALLGKVDGVYVLGFAWKTPGELCNNGGDTLGGQASGVSDWWFAPGHWVNNPSQHYYIHESGISVYSDLALYTVTVEQNEHATLTVDKSEAHGGEVVNVTLKINNPLYQLKAIKVNGEAIVGTSFTMPKADATVTVELEEKDNGLFGYSDANGYAPVGTWSLSEDKQGNLSISTSTDDLKRIYLKETAVDFYFETKINVGLTVASDGNPTTGIAVKGMNSDEGYYFYVKAKNRGANAEIRVMEELQNPGNDFEYMWEGSLLGLTGKAYGEEGEYITLAMAKIDAIFYLYLNGSLVYTGSSVRIGAEDTVKVGIVGMGINTATYYDYCYITDASAVAAKVGADAVSAAAAPAWTAGLESASVIGTDRFAGKSVTFYAQAVEGGVRVAAVATHEKYTTGYIHGNWWLNTNFEMFSGGRQFYLTAAPCSEANLYASAFYTFKNAETNLYTTLAEAFIPAANLNYTDGVARLGFAWKTGGDVINNGNDGESEYWLVKGRPANNGDLQFYIHSTGLSAWKNNTLYEVTAEGSENATVTIDKSEAHEGETVTVTVNVTNDAYELAKILVNGEESAASFTMPAGSVTVTVVLAEKDNGLFSAIGATGSWNLAEDKKGNAQLSVTTSGGEYIYLKQAAPEFYFETKLNIATLDANDGNPTTGIVIKNGEGGLYFYLRAAGLNQANEVRVMRANSIAGFNYAWSGVIVANANKAYSGEGNYITLGVAKIGTNVYFILNGETVLVDTYYNLGVTDNCQIGLVSMGITSYTYYDYSLTTAVSEITAKLGASVVTGAEAPAWTQGLASVGIAGSEEYQGKKVAFYAQVVEGGVRVAAVATHATFTTTAGNWWENTNFEMFSGGTQYFITASPTSSDNIRTEGITSVYNAETGLYTTVIEGFIPASNISIEGGVARLGFAWKTPGDRCNNGNDGVSEYWLVPGHAANNAGQHYYITAAGISESNN